MSTHYLVDGNTSPITNSQINEVRLPGASTQNGFVADASVMNGNFIVRIPDGVQVDNPVDFDDLITQKYAGLLARYPGFTNIIYDDLRDDTGMEDPGGLTTGLVRGERSTFGLNGFSAIDSNPVDVSPTVVTQAVVHWELFRLEYVNPVNGFLERLYVEHEPLDGYIVSISTNNGADYTNVDTEGALVDIPPSEEGSDVLFRISGDGSTDARGVFLGSWAIIY